MTLPNFLFIGPPKTGSTSLYQYLLQHPDIFMCPVKEPAFFRYEGMENMPANQGMVNDIAEYRDLFAGVAGEKAIGEASTCYFGVPCVAENIHRHIPDCRIITILRHPVDRAFSHYNMLRQGGFSDLSFAEFVEQGLRGKPAIDTIPFAHSFYARHLQRYLGFFPRERLAVFKYDDFREDSLALAREVFRFLEVDDTFTPETRRNYNQRFVTNSPIATKIAKQNGVLLKLARRYIPPRYRANIRYGVEKLLSSGPAPQKEELSQELRAELTSWYREDIEQLQALVGNDFSSWTR